MNIKKQSELFLAALESRRRAPIKSRTLKAYASYIRTWIVPLVGNETLANFENGKMREFVAKLSAANLSSASVVSVANCLKGIVGSALDANGNEVYPRKWNNDFIDLPIVDQRDQKAPIITREALQEALSRARGKFRPLYAILAGTGLRIAEAVALGHGNVWVPSESKIVIKGQMQEGRFIAPKTNAGFREIDLPRELNQVLAGLGHPSEAPFDIAMSTAYDAADKDGIPGFHSLRRFRVTRLREVGTPEDILKFWIGHSSNDISDRYSKLAMNVTLRKEWAEKASLGFALGSVSVD